jgi:hypothetical protein
VFDPMMFKQKYIENIKNLNSEEIDSLEDKTEDIEGML